MTMFARRFGQHLIWSDSRSVGRSVGNILTKVRIKKLVEKKILSGEAGYRQGSILDWSVGQFSSRSDFLSVGRAVGDFVEVRFWIVRCLIRN